MRLQVDGRTRDLALFNLAVDSKLRGCDVVALRVEDVAPGGYAVDRATVRQKKTGRPVKFELTDQTHEAVDNYLRASGKRQLKTKNAVAQNSRGLVAAHLT
jgi:integrase